MNKKFEIRVGMPVVLFPTGNSQYHYSKQPLKCTITKIGRKYFYVYYSGREIARFDIETFRLRINGCIFRGEGTRREIDEDPQILSIVLLVAFY